MQRKQIKVGKIGSFHYSPAIAVGDVCYCGGHLGIDQRGNLTKDLECQTRQMIRNLEITLKEAGLTLNHVVRTSLWFHTLEDLETVDKIYAEYFPMAPARTAFEVGRLPLDALVEIDAIAIRPGNVDKD